MILGYAFYASRKVRKPVYISPGHNISLESSINIVKKLSRFKHPEPLRLAHILATSSLR